MTISNLRIWYTRFFALLFIGALYFVLVRSADVGVAGLDTSFWGYRKLIANYADLRLALGDRVFPNVLIGEDDWMIFTAERSMDNYQNTFEFSDEQIVTIQQRLLALHSRLEDQGIVLLVVIVPDKPTLYPEIVPDSIGRKDGSTRLNRLLDYVHVHGPDVFLDLRDMRYDSELPYEIYSKTDSHWNDYGIFLAYQAILDNLKESFPGLVPYTLNDFVIENGNPEILDLSNNIGSVRMRESPVILVPKFQNPATYRVLDISSRRLMMSWVQDEQLPRLLIYHDSFGLPLARWLSMNFRETISVPHYSGGTIWTLNWIEQTAPDVVIIEFAERYFHDLDVLIRE
jgi:alginate O-acetyltransferase complex protein AlgJ